MTYPRIEPDGRLVEPATVTIRLRSFVLAIVASVIVALWCVALAYDIGRTDRAWMEARDAEDRAYSAEVGR